MTDTRAALQAASATWKFKLGDRVRKTKGAQWHGTVVGFYSTDLTPHGYCVESLTELGSVQIYPEAALALMEGTILTPLRAPETDST
jgi:dihydrofolate reductase (trimethoprim resistance protein)